MKYLLLAFFILLTLSVSAQGALIHSHNDYQKAEPLTLALKNRAQYIEADIYLVKDKLLVAHDTSELAQAPTLDELYLKPISSLFNQNKNRISDDPDYRPVLVIDIKKNGAAVLKNLVGKLYEYPNVFDPSINNKGIQVLISGDRGPSVNWDDNPTCVSFDGRPLEIYTSSSLNRVATISDSYGNYSKSADSIDIKIKQLADKTHQQNKLLRLWAIPDHPASWEHLRSLGVDIINTDKVEECRKYFGKN